MFLVGFNRNFTLNPSGYQLSIKIRFFHPFRKLMSGNAGDIRLFKEFRRQVQSTIWLSHSLNISMVKILDGIKQSLPTRPFQSD
jgi:hypothetical protein